MLFRESHKVRLIAVSTIFMLLSTFHVKSQLNLDYCSIPAVLTDSFNVISHVGQNVQFVNQKDSIYSRKDFYQSGKLKSKCSGYFVKVTDREWTEDSLGNLYPKTMSGRKFRAFGDYTLYDEKGGIVTEGTEILPNDSIGTIRRDVRLLDKESKRVLMLGDSTNKIALKRSKLLKFDELTVNSDSLQIVKYFFSAVSLGGDVEFIIKGSQITPEVSEILNRSGIYQCSFYQITVLSKTGRKYLIEGTRSVKIL
jgi:hypothetical protein